MSTCSKHLEMSPSNDRGGEPRPRIARSFDSHAPQSALRPAAKPHKEQPNGGMSSGHRSDPAPDHDATRAAEDAEQGGEARYRAPLSKGFALVRDESVPHASEGKRALPNDFCRPNVEGSDSHGAVLGEAQHTRGEPVGRSASPRGRETGAPQSATI